MRHAGCGGQIAADSLHMPSMDLMWLACPIPLCACGMHTTNTCTHARARLPTPHTPLLRPPSPLHVTNFAGVGSGRGGAGGRGGGGAGVSPEALKDVMVQSALHLQKYKQIRDDYNRLLNK